MCNLGSLTPFIFSSLCSHSMLRPIDNWITDPEKKEATPSPLSLYLKSKKETFLETTSELYFHLNVLNRHIPNPEPIPVAWKLACSYHLGHHFLNQSLVKAMALTKWARTNHVPLPREWSLSSKVQSCHPMGQKSRMEENKFNANNSRWKPTSVLIRTELLSWKKYTYYWWTFLNPQMI